ncbi:MAG TPA: sugar transferase [Solirubrobacteraceae bacterium]|nr:sugar transferase [Solirubrobacteraceae bacterium]
MDSRSHIIAGLIAAPNLSPWAVAKRGIDLVVALLLLLLLVPLLALLALLVRLDTPGPVLFRQTRQGRGRRPFTVFKFRTMSHGAAADLHRRYIAQLAQEGSTAPAGELKKLTADPRVTRAGRVLRKTSLDELPQLINVVRGEMSLVGPRPALDYELEHYRPEHFERFEVRPGITGLWQVSGRSALSFHEMLDLDSEYARRQGPLVDAAILARTPVAVVRGRAA